jgi:hypothetical protein
VLAYVRPQDREQFAQTMGILRAVWLSNEAPGVVPGVVPPALDDRPGPFVLAQDGRQPLAITDGHGEWVHWLDGAAA